MDCLDCNYNEIVEDTENKLHRICINTESEHFLTGVSELFGGCEHGCRECEGCKFYDDFDSTCDNVNSKYCAEVYEDGCDLWESEQHED